MKACLAFHFIISGNYNKFELQNPSTIIARTASQPAISDNLHECYQNHLLFESCSCVWFRFGNFDASPLALEFRKTKPNFNNNPAGKIKKVIMN